MRLVLVFILAPTGAMRVVGVTAVNHGERPVQQQSPGSKRTMGRTKSSSWRGAGPLDSIPGTVAPHHSVAAYFEIAQLEKQGVDDLSRSSAS